MWRWWWWCPDMTLLRRKPFMRECLTTTTIFDLANAMPTFSRPLTMAGFESITASSTRLGMHDHRLAFLLGDAARACYKAPEPFRSGYSRDNPAAYRFSPTRCGAP